MDTNWNSSVNIWVELDSTLYWGVRICLIKDLKNTLIWLTINGENDELIYEHIKEEWAESDTWLTWWEPDTIEDGEIVEDWKIVKNTPLLEFISSFF